MQQTVHPSRVKSSRENDIAIVTLDREVEVSKFVRPICIGDLKTPVQPGDKVVVTGWGMTEAGSHRAARVLQHVWLGRRL